ncbi:MAG: zinc ribbon domain-containing protein [Candidatus Hydrothermarchaeales archaeon]
MFCPRCREQISDISKFCRHCGVKIGYCSNCGDIIEFDSKFCMHCGSDLREYAAVKEAVERPPVPKKAPTFEPEKIPEVEKIEKEALEAAPPVKEELPPPEEKAEKGIIFHEPARSRIAKAVSGTKERLFKITPEGRQVDDFVVKGVIDKLLNEKEFKSLDELKLAVVGQLETQYRLSKDDMAFIQKAIEKKGYTGRFRFDDILAEKVGGRGRLVAIVISAMTFIAFAAFGGVIEEVVVGRLINDPPKVEIQEPPNNLEVSYGQAITFVGTSEDKEDEVLPDASMHWQSSIDGDLGTGNSFSTDVLSVGDHTITLEGTDSKGKSTSRSIVLKILTRGLIYDLLMDKTVDVNGKEVKAYIKVWEPLINEEAPQKGWLEMENPFYKIKVNLDHSYYLLFDKINEMDLLVYNDKVENRADILTGSDIGYTDYSGENAGAFSSTAKDDPDGIGRNQLLIEDKENGFLLVATEGWDYFVADATKGYDAEAEVMFGIFADKPYFIDANEFNNLQSLGIVKDPVWFKNPEEIIKSWVLIGKYDSAVLKGGDLDHLNAERWKPYYEVQTVSFKGRKVWHDGSATFAKQFPTHKLLGDKFGGAIIFSLPEGKFRFDDSLGVYGEQVVNEYIIGVEKPTKITAFTTETVNKEAFFYDDETFQYYDSMLLICIKYGLICPEDPLDPRSWRTKRFAYVITLTTDWYNSDTNQPKDEVYAIADQGLADLKKYEGSILREMEKTAPLAATKVGGML